MWETPMPGIVGVIDIEVSGSDFVFALTDDRVYMSDNIQSMVEVAVEGVSAQASTPMLDLAVDDVGGVWGISAGGLKYWNPDAHSFEHVADLVDGRVIESENGILWIGTGGRRLYRYDTETKALESFTGAGEASDLCFDSRGRLWIGYSSAGLAMFIPDTHEFRDFEIDSQHPYKIHSPRIESLFCDGENRLWIGSVDSGLYSVDIRKTNNLAYTRRSGTASLPNGPIRVINEDSLGYLWVGSDIGGLARIDPLTNTIHQYSRNSLDYFSLGSDNITTVLEDSTGRIWVGTDRGPALYILEVDGFEPPGMMMGGWPEMNDAQVLAMTEGGDGSIWISLRSGNLHKIDTLERDYRTFAFSPVSVPTILYSDRFGSVWAGSRTNLWLFGDDGRLVRTWNLLSDIPGDALDGGISAIFSDSRDRLWIGGPDGLMRYRPETGTFEERLITGDSVPISGITEDSEGHLWFASGRLIHILDRDEVYLETLGPASGFTPSGFISDIARDGAGRVLVGANGEIWEFSEIPEIPEDPMPTVHLTAIRISDKRRIFGLEASETESLSLRSDENSLRIDFGAVDHRSGTQLRYEYRLSGVEDVWIDSHLNQTVYYANLPYRCMTFTVRAFDPISGRRGPDETLDIRILRPAWQSWWAIVVYLAICFGLVMVSRKLREGHQLRGQVSALEEARSKAVKANAELEYLTMNDALSGLLNRRGFDQAIDHALNTARRNQLMISVFMMDVDYFKFYNDNYGHVAGDEVLRNVGKALRSVFGRSTDIIARYGGEEFAVVFIAENPDATVTLADDLLKAIRNLDIVHEYSRASNRLTLSIGSATIRADADLEARYLIELSDKALYAAKEGGRKRVCYTGIIPDLPDEMTNGTAPMILDTENV